MPPRKPRTPPHAAGPTITTGVYRIPPGDTRQGTLSGWVISVTLGGRCHYVDPAQPFVLTPVDALLIHPLVSQSWRADPQQGWHVAYAAFTPRPHWLAWMRWPALDGAPGYARHTLSDPTYRRRLIRSMQRMDAFTRSSLPDRDEHAMCALEQALLWCRADMARQSSLLDDRVSRAVAYLTSRFAEPITLTTLAKACHTSRSHLAYLFHEQVGMPAMKYLEQQRMDRARQLLKMTTDPVRAVAPAVGFEDAKHFAKRFRVVVGLSPSEYRARGGTT